MNNNGDCFVHDYKDSYRTNIFASIRRRLFSMRLRSNQGSERRVHPLVIVFICALVVLILPSIYFSSIVSTSLLMPKYDKSNFLNMTDTANNVFHGEHNLMMTHSDTEGKVKPLLAVVACTRSKGDWQHINSTSLHSLLIPSIEKTVTVYELKRYRIEFVIGFDKGDVFWEKETNRQHLSKASLLPINFVSIPKKQHRPHQIPFNQLCRAAYDYGADYIVRVNDDSEFVTTNWITQSIQRLQEYSPPNVGVVGPTCKQGNTAILTHDLVHRTHLDIFNDYYPDEFDNWWIDDWITHVYGPHRTTKLRSWEVLHHVNKHGTRYKVDLKLQAQLKITLERGRKSIDTYLQNRTGEPGTYRVLGTNHIHDAWGPMKAFHNTTSWMR